MTFKKVAILVLMAVAYLATFILGAASGAIHPACYAYAHYGWMAVAFAIASILVYFCGLMCSCNTPQNSDH